MESSSRNPYQFFMVYHRVSSWTPLGSVLISMIQYIFTFTVMTMNTDDKSVTISSKHIFESRGYWWSCSNKLHLKEAKTCSVFHCPAQCVRGSVCNVTLHKYALLPLKSVTFFGVRIQDNLKWDEHTNYLVKTLHKKAFFSKMTKKRQTKSSE